MSKTLARVFRGATKAIAAACLASSAYAANDWVNFATVSMTNPTTPNLINGYGCRTDGKDILCDSNASAVSFGTGGLIDYGGLTVLGGVSASAVSATYVSGSAIQVGTGGGLGCTAGLNGSLRYSSASNTLEICTGSSWTGLASGTITGSGVSGGSATAIAFWNGPNSLTYESATTGGLYWDHANGMMGVGTNNPSRTIDVSGTLRSFGSSNGLELNTGNTGGGIGALLAFNIPTKVTTLQSIEQGVQYLPILLNPNGGNVGVGMLVSPSSRLQVNGEVQVSSTGVACTSSINGGAIRYSAGTLYYCNGANTWATISGGGAGFTGGGSATAIAFWNGTDSLTYESATTSGLYWDHTNSRLGIGTNSPTATVNVSASGAAFKLDDWATSGANAKVSLGLPSLNTQARGEMQMYAPTGAGSEYLRFNFVNSSATGYTDVLTINRLGNVGVNGVITPTATLQVSGTFIVSQTGQDSLASASLAVDARGISVSSIVHYAGVSGNAMGAGSNQIVSNTTNVTAYSAGSVTITTNGSQRMVVDSSGNVGIGTATPNQPLTVNGIIQAGVTGNNGQINFGGANEYIGSNNAGHLVAIGTNGSERMRIDSSGSMGIGTTNLGGSSLTVVGQTGSNGYGELLLYAGSGGPWTRVLSNILGGNYNPLAASGDHAIIFSNGTAGTGSLLIAPWSASSAGLKMASNGNVTITGSGTTCTIGNGTGTTSCTSDRRLKDHIEPIAGALEKLMLIRGVTYHWRDPAKAALEHIGVIAQDVEKAFPQAVDEVSNTALVTAKTVDYAVLVAPMIEGMRELKHDNDSLVLRTAALEKDLKVANDNITGLCTMLRAQRGAIDALRAENAALSRRVESLAGTRGKPISSVH